MWSFDVRGKRTEIIKKQTSNFLMVTSGGGAEKMFYCYHFRVKGISNLLPPISKFTAQVF